MARKSSSKNDDGLGCLFSIFEIMGAILMLLFSSENPTAKKVGWGILGTIALFAMLLGGGFSGEEATVIILVLGVIAVIVLIIYALKSSSESKKRTSQTYSGEASEKSPTEAETAMKPIKRETFEEQLKKMEDQVKIVCGENYKLTKAAEKENIILETKYYHSVEDALKDHAVPSGYRKIMIERIQSTDIKECPGLLWKDDTMLYALPLLRNSKIYNWPLVSAPIILYEKRTNPDVNKEYMDVGKAEIAAEFEEVFPEYPFGSDGVYTGKFILPIGLEVTNTSGKTLFDLISAEFHVVDDITQSTWYVKEIKELYQKKILKENGIISFEQYAEEKESLLKGYRLREKDDAKYEQQIQEARKLDLI